MPYIIDGNNLAFALARITGKNKFNPRDNKDFQEEIINLIKRFNKKNKEIFLVFDGSDFFGDKYTDGNLHIVQAPRNEICYSADDKILEILEKFKKSQDLSIILISDDQELGERSLSVLNSGNLTIKKASCFAKQLFRNLPKYFQEKKKRKDNWKNSLNKELLEIWKNK